MFNSIKKSIFKKSNLGFTLIEIVVSFSIITLVFFSLINSFPFGLKVTEESENSTIASYLAQERIEELFAQGYINLNTGTIEVKQRLSSDPASYLYQFQRESVVSHIDSDLNDSMSETGMKRISVNIYYYDAFSKQEKAYNINTLISEL